MQKWCTIQIFQIFVKGYIFLPLAKNIGKNIGKSISKNLSSKYSQKRLDHAKESAIGVLFKTALKSAIQKSPNYLIGKKIADKIIKLSKTLQ